jgi:RNA polymerase-binding transcription factor DksA
MIDVLTPRLREELIETLHRERDRLHRSVRALTAAERALSESQGEEGDSAGAPGDVASDLAEQDLDSALKEAERLRLGEVEAALDRLSTGSYGICETCQGPIATRRLFALPWARRCIDCARACAALTAKP